MKKGSKQFRLAILDNEVAKAKDVNFLEVEVYYTLGGANYFSGGQTQRGIWLAIKPVKVSDGMVKFTMFDGYRDLLEAANKLNRKRVDALFDQVRSDIDAKTGKAWKLMQAVLAKDGLALAEPVAV